MLYTLRAPSTLRGKTASSRDAGSGARCCACWGPTEKSERTPSGDPVLDSRQVGDHLESITCVFGLAASKPALCSPGCR